MFISLLRRFVLLSLCWHFCLLNRNHIVTHLLWFRLLFLDLRSYFFRDPDRRTPKGDNLIIAPADGKVIVVKQVHDDEFFHADVQQISIFMSPLNVHVNRNPITGTVKHTRYVKGEYFAAFEDKASEKNEQMIVGLEGTRWKSNVQTDCRIHCTEDSLSVKIR